MDLAEGIGRDKIGLQYLANCGVDGILSTKAQIIRSAKELGLLTIQRFFILDSQGLDSIQEMLKNTSPHFMEIMPGVLPKAIRRFASGNIPVIVGGLIEPRQRLPQHSATAQPPFLPVRHICGSCNNYIFTVGD